MKNLVKTTVSVALTMSLMLSMTGCKSLSEVKTTGNEIMECVLEPAFDDLEDYLDEDDKHFDDFTYVLGELDDEDVDLDDLLNFDDSNLKANKVTVNNGDAEIEYTFNVDSGDEYTLTLYLTKVDDEWVIEDGEEFIVDILAIYYEVLVNDGERGSKDFIEESMEEMDTDDYHEFAGSMYEYMTVEWRTIEE